MDLDQAYQRVRTDGVVVPRPDRGLVRLTGPQRIWFLQNTISNDVEDVEPGRWVESCFLQLKGKVVAHFRVGVLADEVWLDVDPPGTADLVDWFTRYRFRTQVEIEDTSPGCLTVIGPDAEALARPGEVRLRDDAVVFGDRLGPHATADVHGDALDELPRAPAELYDVLRLEAAAGAFGVDYGPDTLPQEAGLTPVVSVTKGCYVGQEVMARLHFRGHVNRVLRPLTFEDGLPSAGTELLLDGRKVGVVTSAARSPERGPIGLGMVRVEPEAGTVLELASGGRAVVGPLPEGTKVTNR